MQGQLLEAGQAAFPEGFSRWGGWEKQRSEATGFFRVERAGQGWRLVDPDGCAWWSSGLDCVRSDIDAVVSGLEGGLQEPPQGEAYEGCVSQREGQTSVNYLGVNFRRVFGEGWQAKWATIALSQLRQLGFNTVANWSQWQYAQDAQFPYVRPMAWDFQPAPRIYRDFPDVFDPIFDREAAEFATQLEQTKEDPALVGYFLMNEPTWGFSSECPAAGMLFTHEQSHTRDELARFLKARYQTRRRAQTRLGNTGIDGAGPVGYVEGAVVARGDRRPGGIQHHHGGPAVHDALEGVPPCRSESPEPGHPLRLQPAGLGAGGHDRVRCLQYQLLPRDGAGRFGGRRSAVSWTGR